MKKIFVNINNQIRSGWKIAMVLIASLVSTFILSIIPTIIMIIVYVLPEMRGKDFSGSDFSYLINSKISQNQFYIFISTIISAVCLILTIFFALKLFDKKKMKHIGFTSIKRNYSDLLYGLLFGWLSITFVFVFLLFSGNITLVGSFTNPNFSLEILTGLIMFIFVGINEEMFARGYCMTVLKQTESKWVPVIVSSVIFSLMHSLNPNVSLLGFVNIFLVGILFALMFYKTGNLWMPIGYHITWNYFQGNIYGLPVSGMSTSGIYRSEIVNNNILNGGQFGPEAGLAVTILLAFSIVLIWSYKRKKTEIQ